MRIYVIGAEGQVARSLREAALRHGEIVLGCGHRPDIDILNPTSVQAALERFRPDIVVNPAAYTAVDRAEDEPDQAFAVNRDGAGIVAAAAAALDAPIIHFSTDYVFDGIKPSAYVETDATAPQSVYGHSKLMGERLVAGANPDHLILRTSWVYAPFGNNFVRTMLRLGKERDVVRVVDDQIGCPTYAPDIADAVLAISRKICGVTDRTKYTGIYHMAGPDEVTWYDFARAIFNGSATRGGRAVHVDPITSVEYPTRAARPANSRLATGKLTSDFGVRLPAMESSLANCLDRLFSNEERLH